MTEQKVIPCEFVAGLCSNCGESEQGECEGWVTPNTMIEMLTADRDAWKQAHDEQVTKLLEISASRDEYQREADGMAAAHKVERDALTAERDHWKAQHKECTRCLGEALQEATDVGAENDKMSDWWSQMKVERDALKDENMVLDKQLEQAIQDIKKVLTAVGHLTAERDELVAAARLALDALERYQVKRQDFDRFAEEIAALKAVLK